MRILFIHQNFPGQFKHLAPALANKGHVVRALMINQPSKMSANIQITQYHLDRDNLLATHSLAQDTEIKVIHGINCARAMEKMRKEGFVPDIVIGHCGWGETLFVKDVFPDSKFLNSIE
ncbi:MAG: glycosyl transferase family 1, partial [Pseudomonadota bacterium]